MGVLGLDLKALQRVADPSAVRGSFGGRVKLSLL